MMTNAWYNMRLASFWSEDKDKDNNKWSTTRGFSIENVKSVLNWRKQSQSGQLQRRGTRKGVTESHTQQDVGSTTYLSAQVQRLKWNSWTQLAFVGIPIVEITFGWEQVKCVQKIVIALSDLRWKRFMVLNHLKQIYVLPFFRHVCCHSLNWFSIKLC